MVTLINRRSLRSNYPDDQQVVLTGTQIYWTEEAECALEEYEGGQEDAVKRYLQVRS